jgi:5-methylthioadenosine/S-adenosylhomocysteine deaminase
MGDRWTLELLLNAHPLTGVGPTAEEKYLAAKLSACEMALLGCTAFIDMFAEFPLPSRDGLEAAGQAYMDVGIRAMIAPMMATRSFYQAIPGLLDALPGPLQVKVGRMQPGSGPDAIAVCRDALQHWPHDRERVKLGLGPTIPHHCDGDFWRTCRDLAREYDTIVTSHLAESKLQAVASGSL